MAPKAAAAAGKKIGKELRLTDLSHCCLACFASPALLFCTRCKDPGPSLPSRLPTSSRFLSWRRPHRFLLLLLLLLAISSKSASSSSVFEYLTSRNLSILALGDSLTAGMVLTAPSQGRKHPSVHFAPYTIRLQALIDKSAGNESSLRVVNAGVSGENTNDVLKRLPKLLSHHKSIGLALILAGTNDMVPPQSTLSNITSDLNMIHSAFWKIGAMTFAITLPSLSWIQHLPESIAKYKAVNEHLRDELHRVNGSRVLGVLDLEGQFTPQENEENRFFWGIDNAHLSEKGYAVVGDMLYKRIREAAAGLT